MTPIAGRSLRSILFLLALAAIGLTLGGWAIGEIMRLQPCPLCIFQRLLFLLIALLALTGALLPAASRVSGILVAVVAAGGVATAAYQSWLQYQPQAGMDCGFGDCGFGEPTFIERLVDWFGALWPQMFLATGFCSSKDWVLLGLSLANWSALCFIGFLAAAVLILRRRGD
ncbi:MAG: Disulfide oxidoreductase [Candidatus Accumulibacter sp. BA-94]|nr:MAG: Disulfide oxidoreductase [Candidatus Accumulibacter sp. BA-94]